jgi:hypothetical protein
MTGNALIGHTSVEELICHSASYSGRLDPRRSNLDSSSNSKHTTKTKFMFQDREVLVIAGLLNKSITNGQDVEILCRHINHLPPTKGIFQLTLHDTNKQLS